YPDDAYVYMSWMRQAAEGSVLLDNLFTTDPHPGRFFNLLFLILGWFAKVTGLSVLGVFHTARVVFGFCFLITTYAVLRTMIRPLPARKVGYLLVCFSSGVGWLFARRVPNSPIDLWQTEAVSFLCIYQNPLFLAALTAMLLTFLLAFKGVESGKLRWWIAAGVPAGLLANFHSYDIIQLLGTLTCYLILRWLALKKAAPAELLGLAVAAAFSAPGVAYQLRLYQTDPVFRARALVPTGSAHPMYVLLGYGLLVPLLVFGAAALVRRADTKERDALRFLTVWSAVPILLSYIPVSFQRKILMGAHIPISMLAGVGVEYLREKSRLSITTAAGLAVLLTCFTNLRWMHQAVSNIQNNQTESGQRIFLTPQEMEALRWLNKNWRGSNLLAMPLAGISGYAPALAGCKVYAGHWGETPAFSQRLRAVRKFYMPWTSDKWRFELLSKAKIQFVFVGPAERALIHSVTEHAVFRPPSFLKPVFRAGSGDLEVAVYQFNSALGTKNPAFRNRPN
ncbi:MAG: hypothetical protein ACP5R4_03245, partial [Armatimonadota bacterium]